MRTLVSGRLMKAVDAYTIETIGVPSMVLMERAALAVAEQVKNRTKKGACIWTVCGVGNNGADGVAAARILLTEGYEAHVALCGQEEKGTKEFKIQLEIAKKMGVKIHSWKEMETAVWDVVIDAVFGVGLSRAVEGEYFQCMKLISDVNKRQKQEGKLPLKVAVDVPSGICSDTGAVLGTALEADVTVTFGWEKMGTALYPGRAYSGEVVVANIGFLEESLDRTEGDAGCPGRAVTYERADLKQIPPRASYSNKGTFGRVLIVAGSKHMCGAAYLSALAAYRTGAGLVKILTVEENTQTLKTLLPEAILAVYTPDQLMEGRKEFKKIIEEQMNWADVVVLGPGLGSEPYVEYLAEEILTSAFVPVIIDADGLNVIASHPYLTTYYTENIIITPHLGEMARLTGRSIGQIQENLPETALEYASRYGITCVLKDAATVAAGKDKTLYINSSGNSSMAKAGSGDVLTGIIAGLTAIGMEEQAAFMGVYLHGLAGDEAAKKGSHGLLASELANQVGGLI